MGVLDFITGGDKPKMRAASAQELRLGSMADQLLGSHTRTDLTNLSHRYNRYVARDNAARRSDVMGALAADVQQATGGQPSTYRSAVDNALVRAKGLSRILRATSDDYDSLVARERLGVAQAGRARQGVGLAALTDIARMGDATAGANFARSQQKSALRANTLGGIVGMGIGAIPDIRAAINTRRLGNSQVGGMGAGSGAVPTGSSGYV